MNFSSEQEGAVPSGSVVWLSVTVGPQRSAGLSSEGTFSPGHLPPRSYRGTAVPAPTHASAGPPQPRSVPGRP